MGSVGNWNDSECIQKDLESIYLWANNNNMAFNGNKFELLRYGTARPSNYIYTQPNGSPIQEVEMVRDLGIKITNDLNFSAQIHKAMNEGKRLAGWVLRVFRTREMQPMLTLFKSLVRPQLEYCCQLWSPNNLGNVRLLEGVQRSYTAKITSISHLNYWQRPERLQLQSLERRRERYQIIYIFTR